MAEYKAIPAFYHLGSSRIKHLDHNDLKTYPWKSRKTEKACKFSWNASHSHGDGIHPGLNKIRACEDWSISFSYFIDNLPWIDYWLDRDSVCFFFIACFSDTINTTPLYVHSLSWFQSLCIHIYPKLFFPTFYSNLSFSQNSSIYSC